MSLLRNTQFSQMVSECRSSPVKARHHRPFRNRKTATQLLIGKLLKLSKDEDLEIGSVQQRERAADENGSLRANGLLSGGTGRIGRGGTAGALFLLAGGNRRNFIAFRFEPPVTKVQRDSVQPCVKPGLATKTCDLPKGPQEGLLANFGRILAVSQKTESGRVKAIPVRLGQLNESLPVTATGAS